MATIINWHKWFSWQVWQIRLRRQLGRFRSVIGRCFEIVIAEYGKGSRGAKSVVRVDPFASATLSFPPALTVIDIGGSHGQFVREALQVFPEARIYTFEPIPACFAELTELAREHSRIKPRQLAISDSSGSDTFNVSSFSDSSSFQTMRTAHLEAWPHTALKEQIRVEKARLDDLFDPATLAQPVFIKIDVQGHELQVIRGARQVIAASQRVMLECNFAELYDGQPSFDQIHQEMRKLGFALDCLISPLRHPSTGELMSSDLIYFKTCSNPKDL